MSKHERKCEHCGHWNDVELEKCESCGEEFNRVFKEDMEKLRKKKPFDIPVITIHPDDSPPFKFFKKIVQFHQLIFYAIIGFLVYLSTSLSH
jgi:primosomal protein N'